ncbi:MAG: MBL fold metallo-hydrolase [Steroidobacteraceae bacterium]
MNNIRVLCATAVVAACGLFALPRAALALPVPDTLPASNGGELTVQPVHHAALMLSWNGKRVLVDPAPLARNVDAAIGEFKVLMSPDIILITHIHGDHFSVPVLRAVAGPNTTIIAPQNVYDAMPADLKAKTHVLANGENTTAHDIPVEAVPMYNTTPARSHFHPKGTGNGYIVTLGAKRVYVAGDTEESPPLAHLRHIDVAFIPMNLPYTETVQAAAKWVRDFRPQYVYPYHYRNMDGTFADLQQFKKLVGHASHVELRAWYPSAPHSR